MTKFLLLIFPVLIYVSLADNEKCDYKYGKPLNDTAVSVNKTVQIPPGNTNWQFDFPRLAGGRTTFVCVNIEGLGAPGGPQVEYKYEEKEQLVFSFAEPTKEFQYAHVLANVTGFF